MTPSTCATVTRSCGGVSSTERSRPGSPAQIVRTTRDHPLDIALKVDPLVAPYADRKSAGELVRIVEAHLIRLDPDGAKASCRTAETDQGVWVCPSSDHGTREIFIRTTSAAATFFDARIDRIADDLKLCGDESPKDIRRATAVGMIGSGHPRPVHRPRRPDPAHSPRPRYVVCAPHRRSPHHQHGVARVEGTGPVTVDQIRRWLGHSQVTVKPVIDLNQPSPRRRLRDPRPTPRSSPPDHTDRLLPLRHQHSRPKDIDHTTPYDARSTRPNPNREPRPADPLPPPDQNP